MLRSRFMSFSFSLLLPFGLIGCQQPSHDMEGHGGPPPRPAELDKLNDFIGNWTGDGEAIMHGPDGPKTMKSTGKESVTWTCDNRFVMSQMEYSMGEMGTMTGISMMTWDPRAKVYRSWWFDSFGMTGEGRMWWDAKCKCWMMETTGRDPTGCATSGEGCTKMTDANTMEWCFTEFDSWGWNKKMEFKGTSKKQ